MKKIRTVLASIFLIIALVSGAAWTGGGVNPLGDPMPKEDNVDIDE